MGREAALCVHGMQLTVRAAGVVRGQLRDHRGGVLPLLQQAETRGTIERIDEGLRRQRAGARANVRHHGTDGEEAGRDDDANASAARLAGDDRPGHLSLPALPPAGSNPEPLVRPRVAYARG